jgi:hypothetical protein
VLEAGRRQKSTLLSRRGTVQPRLETTADTTVLASNLVPKYLRKLSSVRLSSLRLGGVMVSIILLAR